MPDIKAPEPTVNLTQAQLLSILEEIKKPYVDPKEVAQKEKDRREMHEEWERGQEIKKAQIAACTHMREDNTSAIAWMTNSDGITRGVCQRCPGVFDPSNPDYLRLIRIPTRGQSIVYA